MNPDVHTLTGAYALDALDEVERRLFERHMLDCVECETEVDELRATAAVLGRAVALSPPDRLRRRVLAEISGTRQEPPTARPPRRAVPWATRLTSAAAVLAVLAAVGIGVVATRSQHELGAVRAQLAQLQQGSPVARVLSEGDAHTVSGTAVNGGNAVALVSRRLDEAVLVVTGMPSPPADHVYQVWVMGPNPPRSAGLVSARGPVPPLVISDLTGAREIGITVEPAGGSPRPTSDPIMDLTVPA